jgi:hypothetical protein
MTSRANLGILKIKLPPEMEAVLRDPKTKKMMIDWLEMKGVIGEPKLSELEPEDQDLAIRMIWAELRKRDSA